MYTETVARKFGACLCLATFIWASPAAFAADDIGNEDTPWVIADESIEEAVEIFPDTEAELKAASKGVVARGALDDQAAVLIKGQDIFLDIMRDMAGHLPVSSTGCDRDDLMATNAMIILGSAGMVPGLTAMGAGAGFMGGAIAGGIVTAEIGAVPGVAAFGAVGAVAGGGAGFAAGSAQFGLVGMFVANNVRDVVATTEPCSGGQVRTRSADAPLDSVALPAGFDEAQYWVDFADEPVESGVQERAARTSRKARTSRTARTAARATSRYAGKYESLYVQMIQKLYTNAVYDVARNWDRSRYVPSQAKAFMRQASVRQALKPAIDHIAYVKRYGKLPDGLPARPLSGAQKFIYQWLSGDTSGQRDLWLRAMGLGETRLKVANSRLTWNTPSALRLVGLPPTVSQYLPSASLNAMGLVKATVSPGPFDLVLGKATISGSKVRVGYSIARNSRIGALSLRHKTITGGWQTFFNSSARLTNALSGNVVYKFTSAGPIIDSVSFGNATIKVPSIPVPPVPGINSAVNNIKNQIGSRAKQMATNALPIRAVLDRSADAAKKNLLKTIKGQASALGFDNIDRIASISISGGKLKVRIGGYKSELVLPALPSPAVLSRELKKYESRFRPPAARRSRRR